MNARLSQPAAVILSGGAEIGGVSIAQALRAAQIPYFVASLVGKSLLRGAPGCRALVDLSGSSGDPGRLREQLLNCLSDWRHQTDGKLILFPIEDGGLRCLNEFASDVLELAEFSRAKALRFGGLDKAELFSHLATTEAAKHAPPTEVVDDLAQVVGVLDRLGRDAIFKPALKPWDMELRGMEAKVVTSLGEQEPLPDLLARIEKAWPLSRRWVAQARLRSYPEGEMGVCGVRGAGQFRAMEFVERWKYPAQGGTGCWVETRDGNSLIQAASSVLEAIDHIGLAEVGFLRDASGAGRILEVNARAWLQIGLAERSGLAVVANTVRALSGSDLLPESRLRASVWINLERALAAAATGSAGPRLRSIRALTAALLRKPEIAVYSSTIPRVRRRWVARMWTVLWKRVRGG